MACACADSGSENSISRTVRLLVLICSPRGADYHRMSDRIRYPVAMYPGIGGANGGQSSNDRQEQLEDLQRSIPDCTSDDPQRCAM